MFHTPNIDLTKLQAEAFGIPLVRVETKGEKEIELADLKRAIQQAVEKHGIEGVVTGAVRSTYQATRIQTICAGLKLWCFNPLWLKDQVSILEEVVGSRMDVVLTGVFAEGMGPLLGKKIDADTVKQLKVLAKKFGINPAGEGGEFESTVLDIVWWKKRIKVVRSEKRLQGDSGVLEIQEAQLVDK